MSEPQPRRRAPDVRREQVLDAATSVLLERGLADATMADIAAAAGVAKGTTYLYFESKQALIEGLRQRYVETIVESIRSEVGTARNRSARLEAFVRVLITASARERELHHVLFHEAGFSESDAFGPVRELLVEIVGDGHSDVVVDFVLGGVHASVVSAAHSSAAGRRRGIDETTRLVERCLMRPSHTHA